ncbi:PepSY domain-containing protein [Neptuniibacter sp. QD72_48]|uniref:PepSY domain-containing protein n=1 Tax=unclassified Neptuniibacter TaxID=2630693 RepID=UPI0039F5CB7F
MLIRIILLLYVLLAPLAQAQELSADEVLKLVKDGKVMPLEEILSLHPEISDARLLDLSLSREGEDSYVYSVEVINKSNSVVEFEIDAVTGLFLQEQFEE